MDSGLLLLLQVGAAGAAAYVGAYWAKRGESKAILADLDKVLTQVSAVTKTTKEIEATISIDMWSRQKRWEIKRDVLIEIVRELGSVEFSLAIMDLTFRKRTPLEVKIDRKEKEEAAEGWNATLLAFKKAKTLAFMVCSEDVRKALEDLQGSITKLAGEAASGQMESADWYVGLVKQTRLVTELIRSDLDLNDIAYAPIH